MAKCQTCGMAHLDWQRPEGTGYCHGYREPGEHYHRTYEELLLCDGSASSKQVERVRWSQGRRKAAPETVERPTPPAAAGDGT